MNLLGVNESMPLRVRLLGPIRVALVGIATVISPTNINADGTDVPRFALVIGAEQYDTRGGLGLPPVPNALHDAIEVAKALHAAGFTVRLVTEPETAPKIYESIAEISQQLHSNEPAVLVFYFAGHGFQKGSHNYLVPILAKNDKDTLTTESVPVSSIFLDLMKHRGLTLFFLDACRTLLSPGRPAEPPIAAASAPGFASVAKQAGVIVGLASQYNQPALSAARIGDPNSPYSKSLATQINLPRTSLDDLFNNINTYVRIATGEGQVPEVVKDIDARFFRFMRRQEDADAEAASWQLARDTNRTDCVRQYILEHPDSRYLQTAHQWMDEGGHTTGIGGIGCPRQ